MKHKPTPVKAAAKHTAKASTRASSPDMVSKSTALVLVVLGLLAGLFIGWQGALMYFSQELHTAGTAAQQAAPPAGMPAAMPGGAGADLMAQAKALEAKVAANPNDTQALVDLANLYFDQGMHQKAIFTYERALKQKNDMPDVWTDLGVMYRADKRFPDALAAFNQAITLNPKHEIARLNTGIVLMMDMNDTAGALKAWKDLLAINPEAKTPDGKRLADVVKAMPAAK